MTLDAKEDRFKAELRTKLEKKFKGMMSALFKEEGSSLRIDILGEPEVTDFIDTHAEILDSAFAETPMSDLMRQRLQESDWIFSGMKTFHELNEAFPSLLDEKGNRKPFEQFLNDVQKIDDTYNRNYLRAEYNFAGASAEMAGKWEAYGEDGDDYYLQYRTAGDDKVRPEHAELNGITLPASDSFWDSYFPPNGWNCRCTVVQVLKSKNTPSDHNKAMEAGGRAIADDQTRKMFSFNPGKQGRVFPAYNPYTISKCLTCDKAKLMLGKEFIPDNQVCAACAVNKENAVDRNEEIKGYAARRKELWNIVKCTPSKPAHHSSLEGNILISNGSKKEWINQPHKHYAEKNELILDINSVIEHSKYVGKSDVHSGNPMIVCSHLFEIDILGDKSHIIVHEYQDGELRLHSISDNVQ